LCLLTETRSQEQVGAAFRGGYRADGPFAGSLNPYHPSAYQLS
jgi:hypothetical protein